jgi:hypothetical protein
LDNGSECDEACRECYSNPHYRLELMSKIRSHLGGGVRVELYQECGF